MIERIEYRSKDGRTAATIERRMQITGKPMWAAEFVKEARLTTVVKRHTFRNKIQARRAALDWTGRAQ